MSDTDLQLLARYVREKAEDAFAELVRRHLPLVFSAALRQVRSPQLAEEVAQSVFTDLARTASRLAPDTILSAWLYRVTRCTAIDVVRREARRQAREQTAAELTAMNAAGSSHPNAETEADWAQVGPLLDEAMDALGEPDRTAVLLRYFENKPLLEVGRTLGTSEEAARKRVSRSVERLRAFLAKRGVAVGGSGLVLVISANAVQAVPAALATSISTAALLVGKSLISAGTVTATKAIAMTTLQKTLITVTVVAAVGTGIYEASQASRLRSENRTLQQQYAPLSSQVQQLQRERDAATGRLAEVQEELTKLKSGQNTAGLLKLRGEVASLRQRLVSGQETTSAPAGGLAKMMNDPVMKDYIRQALVEKLRSMYNPLFVELKLTQEQKDKFLQLQADHASQSIARLAAAGQGASAPAGAAQAGAGSDEEMAARLKELLGDAGYARYEDFGKEIPARATLTALGSHLEDNPLTDEQSARLLQVVKAEPHDLTSGMTGAPDMAFRGSQADIDNFLQRVGESNQRILQQSASFLNPGQLQELNGVLTNAIELRKVQSAAFIPKR